jgi:PAS domain S-box-containing protein
MPEPTPVSTLGVSELLEVVVDTTFSGVAVVDPTSGQILYVNERACLLLGRQRGELLATTWQRITDADDLELSTYRAKRLLSGELQRFSYRKRVRHLDGTWVHLGLVISRVAVGNEVVFVVHIDDMTREGSVSALIRLVATLPDGDTLARAVVLGVLDGLEVFGASLYQVDLRRECLVTVGNYGARYTPSSLVIQIPLDAQLPGAEVFRTGTEYNATMQNMADQYPLSAGWVSLQGYPDTSEVSILPVFAGGLVTAIVVLVSHEPLSRQWQVRTVLDTLCACIACWSEVRNARTGSGTQLSAGNLQVTARQRQILQLVAGRLTNQQIAVELGFSEGTVRSDLHRLTRMLQVRGRENLVHTARRSGILDEGR